jgi:type IV pilus assembly protein PilM
VNGVNRGNWASLMINDHVIRYVLSTHSSKGLVYKSYGERYLPSGMIIEGKIIERETLLMILEECISDWKLRGKSLLFTVPDSAVVVRRVEVEDEVPDDEVKGHLYLELSETLHLPFDEPVFDINIVGQTNGKKDVILIGTPEDTINDYKELFQEVKLKPVVADLSSLAVYRLLFHLDMANPSEHLLSLQLTVDSMNVTIFHKHVPVFTRHVKLAIENGSWEVKRDLESHDQLYWHGDRIEVERQLLDAISELERIMNFYRFSLTKGKDQISKLSITGDHPELLSFITRCKDTFNLGIHNLHNVEIVTKDGQAIPSRFQEVIGLSLK